MIHHTARDAFSAGLHQLRHQLLPAFTAQRAPAVRDPVMFSAIATAGRNAKDAMPRYSPSP